MRLTGRLRSSRYRITGIEMDVHLSEHPQEINRRSSKVRLEQASLHHQRSQHFKALDTRIDRRIHVRIEFQTDIVRVPQ